jgi:DNA-binding GntR family transcriptional regulator
LKIPKRTTGDQRKTHQKLGFRSEKERIYSELRKEILAFDLTPHELLVEAAVAQRFGVSKAPVREALAILQRDGLIEALPRKGYLVTAVTFQDVRELFELRVVLEGSAAELAAAKITDQSLDYLAALKPKSSTIKEFLDYNSEFHSIIARESQNGRLARLIQQTIDEMGRAIAAAYEFGEHDDLIAALRARNPARARVAMVTHIQEAQARAATRGARVFPPPYS